MDSVTRCQNRKAKQKVVSVADIINKVVTDICDYYCKYPEQYKDYDDMLDERCKDCPLNKLT